ncbi:ATP-binding cassette domain-containing protein [uncultured Nostoc sp.]|uniref:ATP-binding cassette domain-containing protein n=1 Tax=uncultured Nostoc sp. TaxID=340711 RepID=UPI0035CAEA19
MIPWKFEIISKGSRHLFTAVQDVSFAVKPKEKFVIIGSSGCGKSSLLKAIAGFQPIKCRSIAIHLIVLDHN